MGSYEQVVHATTYFSDVEFIELASKYELRYSPRRRDNFNGTITKSERGIQS